MWGCTASAPSSINALVMRRQELFRIRAVTDEVKKRADRDNSTKCRYPNCWPTTPATMRASYRATHPLRARRVRYRGRWPVAGPHDEFCFRPQNTVTHGENNAVAEIPWKQIRNDHHRDQHDTTFGQLRSQLRPRHDGHRSAVRRFLGRADRCSVQRRKFPACK